MIQGNGGYNSPALGQAAQNIAQMFAPPSAGELAAYSTARSNNQKSNIIAQLASDPTYQGFDHQAILADLYDPTQSFYRVNTDDSTNRRGQDISAATSRANNADTNRTSLISNMFGALNQGQVRPTLPGDIASMYNLPEMPQVAGAPKPLSQDETTAAEMQRLIGTGQITDDMLTSLVLDSVQNENIVDPETGRPVIVPRDQAVGAEPYFNPGAEAKPTNGVAVLRDGSRVPAVQGKDGVWRTAQTNEPLPSDIQIFAIPQAQGTAAEVGLSSSTDSGVQQQLIDIAVAKDTATALRDLVAESPSSQGLVGWMRGTAQNVIQTGGELGGFFGGGVSDVMADIENGLADRNLAGAFDENIPAIDMLANLLAFQYAKTTTGERLSNEMLRAAKEALGLNGLDANQANSLARLNQAIAQIEAQENILRRARDGGVDALVTPAAPRPPAPPQPPGAPTPETGPEVWDFDENGQLVRVQ